MSHFLAGLNSDPQVIIINVVQDIIEYAHIRQWIGNICPSSAWNSLAGTILPRKTHIYVSMRGNDKSKDKSPLQIYYDYEYQMLSLEVMARGKNDNATDGKVSSTEDSSALYYYAANQARSWQPDF